MSQQKEEEMQRPPSYTAGPDHMVVYPGMPGQQVMYAPGGQHVPQQGYVIQNVPTSAQTGCCSGRSERFRHSAGVSTGTIQIALAILTIVLSSVTFCVITDSPAYPGAFASIGAAVIFYLPAGILGVVAKNKSNCVIVAYLVMSILSAIEAFWVCGVEGTAAAFYSYDTNCPHQPDYVPFPESSDSDIFHDNDMIERDSYGSCFYTRVTSVFVIHIVLAVLSFIEFIVAIVASAYSCGGLRCCCQRNAQQRTVTMLQYNPLGNVQPPPAQMEAHVVQAAGPIPNKS